MRSTRIRDARRERRAPLLGANRTSRTNRAPLLRRHRTRNAVRDRLYAGSRKRRRRRRARARFSSLHRAPKSGGRTEPARRPQARNRARGAGPRAPPSLRAPPSRPGGVRSRVRRLRTRPLFHEGSRARGHHRRRAARSNDLRSSSRARVVRLLRKADGVAAHTAASRLGRDWPARRPRNARVPERARSAARSNAATLRHPRRSRRAHAPFRDRAPSARRAVRAGTCAPAAPQRGGRSPDRTRGDNRRRLLTRRLRPRANAPPQARSLRIPERGTRRSLRNSRSDRTPRTRRAGRENADPRG